MVFPNFCVGPITLVYIPEPVFLDLRVCGFIVQNCIAQSIRKIHKAAATRDMTTIRKIPVKPPK